ncbi:MAG TPA: 50S ribosomal protein L29 [Deltaproteobacteria bacterium]|nr:50S ribosomal protein L29 [Deltaproteobacteria bacterium]
MKSSEIREMGLEEMQRKRDDLKEEMFNLRFQHGAGQLENTAKLKQTKHDIARIETLIIEQQRADKTEVE